MSNPEKPSAPAPGLRVRLAWWFGLYGAGQILFMVCMPPGVFWMFPVGIGLLIWNLFPMLPDPRDATLAIFIGLAYFIYLGHLFLTLKVRSEKRFKLFIFCLVILLAADTAGWVLAFTKSP